MAGPARAMPWPVPSISAANWWIGGCSAFGAHFGGRACERPQTFAGRTRQPRHCSCCVKTSPCCRHCATVSPYCHHSRCFAGACPSSRVGDCPPWSSHELQTQAQVAPRMLLIQLSTLIVSIKSGRKSPKSSEGRPIRLPETTQWPLLPTSCRVRLSIRNYWLRLHCLLDCRQSSQSQTATLTLPHRS